MHERGYVDVNLFGLFALCLYATTTGHVCYFVLLVYKNLQILVSNVDAISLLFYFFNNSKLFG